MHKALRQTEKKNSSNNLEVSPKSRIEEVTIINHDVFLKEVEQNQIQHLGKLQNKNFVKPETKIEEASKIIKINEINRETIKVLQPENLIEMLLEEELDKKFINHEIEKLIISKKRENGINSHEKIINNDPLIIDEVEVFSNSILDEIFVSKFLAGLSGKETNDISDSVICIFKIENKQISIVNTETNQCGYEEINFGIEEPLAEKKYLFNKILSYFYDSKFLKVIEESDLVDATIFIYKNYQIECHNEILINLILEDIKLNNPVVTRTFDFVNKAKEIKIFISVGDEIYDEIAEFYLDLFKLNNNVDFDRKDFEQFRIKALEDNEFKKVFEHYSKVPMKFLAEVENRTNVQKNNLI